MAKPKHFGAMTAGLALGGSALLAAAPASAAGWHGVSGTVYDPCSGHTWYESSNARTKSGTGAVKLQFSQLPPGGVAWKLLGKSNQQYGTEQEWTSGETGITRTLDSSLAGGTTFYNDFKENNGACSEHSYNFQGSEYY